MGTAATHRVIPVRWTAGMVRRKPSRTGLESHVPTAVGIRLDIRADALLGAREKPSLSAVVQRSGSSRPRGPVCRNVGSACRGRCSTRSIAALDGISERAASRRGGLACIDRGRSCDEGLEATFEFADKPVRGRPCASIALKPGNAATARPTRHECTAERRQIIAGLAPASYVVEVSAPEHETWRQQMNLSEDVTIPVALRPGVAVVNGEILADGHPLAGAPVRLGRSRAVSDGAGRFTMQAPTGWTTLAVMDPRSGDTFSSSVELEAGANRVFFDLSRRRFAGNVVDAGGTPVAGAHVTLNSVDAHDHYRTVTDDSGFFAVDARSGRYRAQAASRRGSRDELIDLREGPIEGHVFQFETKGSIRITASALSSGETAQAWISHSPVDRGYPLQADAPGLFDARTPALGEWFVSLSTSANRHGFASVELTARRPSASIEVPLGEHAVTGEVRIDGATVAGVAVFLMHEETLGVRSMLTSGDGAFGFLGARPGRYWMMAEGEIRLVNVPRTSGPILFDVALGEAGIVVAGAERIASGLQGNLELWPERLSRELSAQLGVLRRFVVSFPTGTVSTGRLPVGEYRLAVDVPGFGLTRGLIHIQPGANTYRIDLTPASSPLKH